MQVKIESRNDFENLIKNNPVELLQAIKHRSLSFQEHRCEISIILDVMKALINLKQRDQESLTDYTRRLKAG
jgi:hypothetical protein